MTLGEKIRDARVKARMTQAELSQGIVTRNMLCSIEKGATPSLDTIIKIAKRLHLPVEYFFSDKDDAFTFLKNEKIAEIRAAIGNKSYSKAIKLCESLDGTDDEIAYILAHSHFELGVNAAKNGSLVSAEGHFSSFRKYAEYTVYDLTRERTVALLYEAVSKNIQSPLLELESEKYESISLASISYEYYKYLTMDMTYEYTTDFLSKHIKAKKLIKERKYTAAISLLTDIEENKTPDYDAYLIFSVYTDLEFCHKQICDFESAYRYSTKRFSLLEGYKT